ncbi:PREDICTED: CD109 antigen-like [Ceratosolen solmsi marchali]|uniref:CD109 antigen n=1 Tax=Ceratosolen solmsi marchali TaxID=326594 RepID=A0AAJ6YRF7_9HYME|nr:PREDICTED: CD109 antigen-like [Ceratosolen solmsi marchali]
MDWSSWSFLLFICSLATYNAAGQTYYTIVAPKIIRPNSEYHVAVSIIGYSEPTTTFVELSGQLDNGESFAVSESVVVEPFATRILSLEIGDTGPGNYRLLARSLNGYAFVNSTELEYVHKSYAVLLQTDRSVYKPGNKIQFRCIVLNSRLRPTASRQFEVYITDGQGNRIKQWDRPTLHQGIFNAELELSQSPVLGDWEIIANVGNQTFRKTVQVAEYILPKFEVTIDAPLHATFKEGKITVIVHAKYTYGKPVKGEATITAFPDIYSPVLQPVYQSPIRKIIKIEGKATVDFDIINDLRVTDDDYRRPVVIEVAVEEAVTGRRQNNSMQITLHKHKYTMDLLRTAEYYKPGMKYTAFLKVAYHDGSPVIDNTNPVHISYGYTYDHENLYNMTKMLDRNGMIELNFHPPTLVPDHIFRPLRIEAQYLNLHEWFPSTNPASSRSEVYIQATLRTEKPMVNEYIEIEVNSTNPLKYLSYQVFGRGDILTANSIQVSDRRTATFQFLTTYVMAPVAHLLVYYVSDDGEIIADSLDIELDGALQNFVDIKMIPDEVEPGDNVDLTIMAKPNSYVGLLGVDQRSLLLKSGNDISHDQIRKLLMSYDSNEANFNDEENLASTEEIFRKTGVVILTNGYLHENPQLMHPDENGDRVKGPTPGLSISTLKPDIGPPVKHRFATRPSWAGRYAFSYVPLLPWRPRVFLMHDISDTWLFANMSSGYEGKTVIRRTLPDTITSWILTGFSVDPIYGLGLIESPRKLKVFKPFFISMNLPYSVIRGEIVAIPIVIFNYLNRDLSTEVVLENNGDFEFAEISNEVHETKRLELYRTKKLFIQANSAQSVSFMVIPTKLNHITIKAKATSSMAGDSIEYPLLIKAEGETQYRNKVVFADLMKTNVSVNIPKYFVSDSDYVEISAVGDMLGPSIPNLAKLIKMPFGCGEQNMLNFVPNIVILDYLTNTNQLSPAIESKAIRYLETGYQQELTYRHADGSFSAFGKTDPSGSTWLTAFVAKSFKQAEKYITVEEKIVSDALKWLAEKQAANGSFPEVGTVSHRDMQGGAGKGLALTAYVLSAFLEAESFESRYRNVIYKGVEYVVRNMQNLEDNYALSICTYVLSLARNAYEDEAFRLLESRATIKDGQKWWSKPVPKNDKNPWYVLSRSADVEMTSYALLTYLRKNQLSDATIIMKWLVKQRNVEGGFSSTQDTVVGLYALAKLGEKMRTSVYDVQLRITTDIGEQKEININSRNFMIVQKHILFGKTRSINITASGTGFALVQLSSRYNLNVTGAFPLFTLDPQVDTISTNDHLQLSICSGFISTKEVNESNMAVMEVSFPSGFTVDQDALPSLELSQNVKRVETKNGDTMVVLYFDKMVNDKEYCPTVSAYRTHKVAKQKPVPVSIYDYYDSSRRARVFYEPKMTTLCDICEDEQCGDVCSIKAGKREEGTLPSISSSSRAIIDSMLIIVCVFYLSLSSGYIN